jgi:formate dehydrogenase major subunit
MYGTVQSSDWATNCPECKVIAVQVAPAVDRSKWQHAFDERAQQQTKVLKTP